ncbi:hypothetical protein ELH21_09265 [Rhizobium leguminosarum]|uniref:hypothetical protein n=1 Tax=Rhizobium leguminosarum TaxID=384 RepID=UPI001031E6DF|nr:hypothetical protein [Rhizobium leguminosarum]TBD04567.1 hypothetical protein ELH21_09265 [Rhizobium leguminosarum]
MNDEQSLDFLKDKANTLEKEVRDNDFHIERWARALANGEDPGRVIEGLQDYHNRQLGLMFELGKTEAKIEDLENRIREQTDHEREQTLAQDFAEGQPIAQEDYLDWIQPTLEAPVPAEERPQEERHPHYEGEDRMLQEMHREDREPEDYLDWWKR